VQLALDPLWKLYEVCNQGADVKATLSKAVKSLGLTQVMHVTCVISPYIPLASVVWLSGAWASPR